MSAAAPAPIEHSGAGIAAALLFLVDLDPRWVNLAGGPVLPGEGHSATTSLQALKTSKARSGISCVSPPPPSGMST